MGLSPTKPTTNWSNRGGERGYDDTTIEPDNVATISNVPIKPTQQSTNKNWSKDIGDTSGN